MPGQVAARRVRVSNESFRPLGELAEELIAAVGDEGGEVGTVRQLEGQDRRGMASMQALQLGHGPTLPRCRATLQFLVRAPDAEVRLAYRQ
jgi:hypothetical protein